MSYHQRENIVNIVSGILITGIYSLIIYQRHLEGRYDLSSDFEQWGKIFLVFMGVSIVARIAIYIIFHILTAIATRKEDIPVEDEMIKLIKLKGTRNSHYAFSGVMMVSIISLAIGMPVYGIFIAMVIGGLVSEIMDNGSQLFYHRKGV